VNVGGQVVQIAAGFKHTCALLSTGKVRCWGLGSEGKLGYGNTDDLGEYDVPASAGDVSVGGNVIQITAGTAHTCALLDTGKIRCWGSNIALGYGGTDAIGDNELPSSAGDVPLAERAVQVSAGFTHTCALLASGNVRCWGWGLSGQLGYGNTNDVSNASQAGDVALGGKVIQISATAGPFSPANSGRVCALLSTGRVRCWGNGQFGALGYSNTNTIGDDELPSSAGDVLVAY